MSLSPDGHLQVFTIYSHPADVPDAAFLVRVHTIEDGGVKAGCIVGTADSLRGARALIPPEADARFPRARQDPDAVVESWL